MFCKGLLFVLLMIVGILPTTGCASAPTSDSAVVAQPPLEGCLATHVSPRPADMPEDSAPVWLEKKPSADHIATWLSPQQAMILTQRAQAEQAYPMVLVQLTEAREQVREWEEEPDTNTRRTGHLNRWSGRVAELEELKRQLETTLGRQSSTGPREFPTASRN
jgi:hypothetical protein